MTLKELYDQFYYSLAPKKPKLFIEAYESNLLLFTSTSLSNLIEYKYAMILTSDYAMSLEELGYLKKGLVYLEKAINLIEEFPEYQQNNLFDQQYYELLKFHKARALYNLKKYNKSLDIFYELRDAFPNNNRYLGWIYGIKSKKFEIYSWVATGLILIVLILRYYFKGKIPMFDKVSFWVGAICLLLFVIIELIRWILLQKKKKFNTT